VGWRKSVPLAGRHGKRCGMKFLGVLVFVTVAGGFPLAVGGPADAPVPTAEVDRAIRLATHYLVGACGPDGKFVYQVRVADGAVSSDYNVVRHAGAMYALALTGEIAPDAEANGALRRAGRYLRGNYVGPGPVCDGGKTLAVWATPRPWDEDSKATLGAAGLGLVGLLGLEGVELGATPREELRSLGRFLLFMQRPDGSFNSKYYPRDGGTFAAWGSLYYPGEAALALLLLAEREPAGPWRAAGERALAYLAKSRAGATEVPPDNWALIATAKLFALPETAQTAALRGPLVAHAVQICEGILAGQIENSPTGALDGGFEQHGRTTPTSTRLEGLLAALEFLPPERAELRGRIERAVHRGMRFVLRAQIPAGKFAGGVPQAVGAADPEIRIDFVQHFLDALVRYRQRFGTKELTR